MKKFLTISIVLFSFSAAFAQKEKVELYITQFSEFAMNEMIRTGVPASITLLFH